MDSTYKTNAFNWPLFHVVSQTPFGSNITVCLCFIKTETIPQFTWILTQLKQIMLQVGCSPPFAIVTDRDLALTAAVIMFSLQHLNSFASGTSARILLLTADLSWMKVIRIYFENNYGLSLHQRLNKNLEISGKILNAAMKKLQFILIKSGYL